MAPRSLRERRRRTTPTRSWSPRVVIIGTGFSGVAAAIELRRRGIRSFTLLEKADEVGGVWRDNTYPGAACDVPSHLYSFSFAPKHDWSLRFAPQSEIRDYLRDVVRDHGLLSHCRFGTEVAGAAWDEPTATWQVELADGEVLEADVLIAGTGQLNRPAIPDLPGHEAFEGVQFHSARWDHDLDLTGRRVVVLGTGASAIQFVPPVAEVAEHVHVLQRSAPYVIAKADRGYGPFEQAAFRHVPGWDRLYRSYLYVLSEARWPTFGGMPAATRIATRMALRHLEAEVRDPQLREALTPSYAIGCKRVLQSNDWYPALQRDDVEVVLAGAAAIEPDAVVTTDGRRLPCDTIIYGTGFRTTGFLAPMEIVGRDGRDLRTAWQRGAEAHLGVTVAGFPNLFLLYGPNTNLGHNSIVFMIERQAGYIGQAVSALREHDLAAIEVRADVHRRYNDGLQRRLRETVWASGCDSWYVDEHGRIVNNWVGTTVEYWWRTRRFDLDDHVVVHRRDLPVDVPPREAPDDLEVPA